MSKLLSFLGGAGKGVLQGIEKAETNAKEEAMLRIKQLSENFEKVREENTKLTNNLKAEEDWIRQTYKDATPEQIAFLQSSPAALSSLKKMEDPTKINLATVINFASTGDANSVIADKIQVFPKMEKAITEPIRKAMPAYRSALAGFYDEFGEQAGKTAEMRYARATGVDVQTMEAMKPLSRPTSDGKFDMAGVISASKGFSKLLDDGKQLMYDAQKSGDPKLIEAANVVAASIKKTNDAFSTEEKDFAKKLDNAKSILISPDKFTPEEVKEANKVYNNYIDIERRKAVGTKVTDAKDDTPKIGALNSFVSGAVAKELIANFGTQIKNGDLTFTPNASGEVTANVLMTDMGERFKVATLQYQAAERALSIFSDKNGVPFSNDGKAVLGQYKAALDRAREQYAATPEGKTKITPAAAAPPPPETPASAPPAAPVAPPKPAVPTTRPKPANAPADAKLADDGHWYSKNPQNGKFIKWSN